MIVDLSKLDTAPDTMPWWREMDKTVAQQRQTIDTFKANTTADYKQLSSSMSGVLNQYQDLANYVASIPTAQVQSSEISNFGASSGSLTTLTSHTFVVPRNKNYATIVAQFDLSPDTGQSIYMLSVASIGNSYDYISRAYCNGFNASFATTSRTFAVSPGQTYVVRYQVAHEGTVVNVSPNTKANCNSFASFTRV